MDETDPIDTAWKALLDDWDRDEGHKQFIQLASTLGRLPDAGRRYREAREDPARAERAKQGTDRVLAAAMAHLTPTPRDERPAKGAWVLPVVVLALMLAATMALSRLLGVPKLVSPLVIAAEIIVVALFPWGRIMRRLQ